MFMIVLHHFAAHALYPNTLTPSVSISELSIDQIFVSFFHCFIFIGVNVFVLISGFFRIKTSLKGFLKIYVMMAFYLLFSYAVEIYANYDKISSSEIFSYSLSILFPFNNGKWWFLDSYIILFLMAPLLNSAIDALNKKQMTYILVLLTISNLYFGYWKHIENVDGFNVLNFVYLYFIGAYLKPIVR